MLETFKSRNMETFIMIILILIAVKSVTVGGDFSIYKWIKLPKEYWRQYNEWQDKAP
jgi:hypothetical protein